MGQSDKIIVTCAVTGSIHTPTISPHLPITADEIAKAAIGAAEAGASIIHLHACDPWTGKPNQTPEAFEPISEDHQAAIELHRQSDHGRQPVYVRRGTIETGGDLQAGSGIA